MKFFVVLACVVAACNAVKVSTPEYHVNIVHHAAPAGHSAVYNPFIKAPAFPQPSVHPGSSYFGNFIQSPVIYGQSPPMCAAPPRACLKSRYRTLDGTCNNLQNPAWGSANMRYNRLVAAKYADGVSAPTVSVTGEELPNARVVSLVVFGEQDVPDPQFTLANMQWGQIITHDMSMQAGGTQSRKHQTRCCTDDGKLIGKPQAHKTCFPIVTPKNDPAFAQVGTECLNFVRTLTDLDMNCPTVHGTGQAEQLTVVTAFMDLSLVYGNNDDQLRNIRAFRGGRMIVENRNGYDWPPQTPNVTTDCDVQSPQEICYLGGDVRFNQNPGLTIFQIMLLREHNRIADTLAKLNPHWDDETIFQESRRINVAQNQHINYYEWLPLFLGTENMLKNRLIYKTHAGSYVNDYDPSVDPSVLNSHATAAFRYFHSQIEGRLDLISEARSRAGSLRLSDWFNRPAILEAGDNYDFLSRGMGTQPQELTDINFDPEIKHFLFRRGRPFGSDLRSIDIQRNRDHGLASYNDYREFCGMSRAHTWEDFLDLISPRDVNNLKTLYASPEDVDLTVGASLESHVAGALAGPTFLCILTEQFYRTRVGDRFFYERGDKHLAFTRPQLQEIRKASIARIMCDNGNDIHMMQPRAFLRVADNNQLVPCSSIPAIDLSLWQDQAIHGHHISADHSSLYSFKK